ncbi:hypothetical protein SBV1_1690008 [Verrucomicrobia bacterium]|nr:hypothetical protein SBV1_1690008 [Verrucomicrobiota bacterium]
MTRPSLRRLPERLPILWPRPGRIDMILVYKGDVFLIGDDLHSDCYVLYHWPKPAYPETLASQPPHQPR